MVDEISRNKFGTHLRCLRCHYEPYSINQAPGVLFNILKCKGTNKHICLWSFSLHWENYDLKTEYGAKHLVKTDILQCMWGHGGTVWMRTASTPKQNSKTPSEPINEMCLSIFPSSVCLHSANTGTGLHMVTHKPQWHIPVRVLAFLVTIIKSGARKKENDQ